MICSNASLMQLFAMPVVVALATAGCATRGYARRQVAPVDKKVDTLSAVTDAKFMGANEKINLVAGIQKKDISQVNERISTVEAKLASSKAQKAEPNAQQAQALLADTLNYKLVESTDVTFGFNKSSLTPEAKAELDQLATKVHSVPGVLVEVVGFTDATGLQDSLNLSRERADCVQRYLVTQQVPLHVIHTVGLGAEAPPSGLEADASSNPSKSEAEQASRHVLIRIFGPADVVTQASARGGGQN